MNSPPRQTAVNMIMVSRAEDETAATTGLRLARNLVFTTMHSLTSAAMSSIMQATPRSWFGNPSPLKSGPGEVHIFPMIPKADAMESARKKTHARVANANVAAVPAMRSGIDGGRLSAGNMRLTATPRQSTMPCNAPHATKVQFAPCQIPLKRNVAIKLKNL